MTTDESERRLLQGQEEDSVRHQVDLYKQLKEQLLHEAEIYKRSGKESLARVILQSLE
ncbi:MAG: hypothetical protein ABI361_10955 [Nitrososphaera sp.]|jgi:hypothetical protein